MKNKDNKKMDLVIKIILVIIIILLLITNCSLLKKNKEYENNPGLNNVDIIEIKCDNNSCKLRKIESLDFAQRKISIVKGDETRLIAIVKPSELSGSKLTWKSSDPSIATVDENGVVKGKNIGTVTITVTSSNGKTATCIVEVVNEAVNVKNIKLAPEKSSIEAGSMTQIKAIIEPENATNRNLVWISSDPSIVIVDSKGVVKGLKPGTVTITAKTKDGKVVATTTITITEKQSEIESLSFAQDKVSVKKGNETNLVVVIKPSELSDSKLTWTSSNPNIATVDENGKVKGVNTGTVTITVKSPNGKTATCTVEVVDEDIDVESIVLTPTENVINTNSSTQVIAEIEPENATNRDLVWTSSDPSIATVDSKGYVKGLKAGTVTITAKTKDGKVVATTTITIEEENGEFEVYDNVYTPLSWNGSHDLQIFSKTAYTMEGKIAPESSNAYQFYVKNSTVYNLKYNIKFTETNEYHINMKYKLKKNDVYLIDHYVNASELNINDIILNSKDNDVYSLEWKWISSSNDTSIGQNPEAKYGLRIEIEAEGTNE